MATPKELVELIRAAHAACAQMKAAHDNPRLVHSTVDFAVAYAELADALGVYPYVKDQPNPHSPILREPGQFLVFPRPQRAMGMVRIEGHRMRVRKCPRCGSRTTIHMCPVCGQTTETGDAPTDERPYRPGGEQREAPIPGNPSVERVIDPRPPRRLSARAWRQRSQDTAPCTSPPHRWHAGRFGDMQCANDGCGAYLPMPNGGPERGPCIQENADGIGRSFTRDLHQWIEPSRPDDAWRCCRCEKRWTEPTPT